MTGDDRSSLRRAKLRALVRARHGEVAGSDHAFPDGAALADGPRGWVLLEAPSARSAGAVLMWAARHGVDDLAVLVDHPDGQLLGDLARRLGWFPRSTRVWQVRGTLAEPVEAAPLPPVLPADDDTSPLRALLVAEGLDVVVEQGVVRGEVLGLEVARVAAADPGVQGSGPRLEVGVGRFDRVTAAMMYRDLDPSAALATVAAEVRRRRHPGAPPHPIRDLCRERWVRHAVMADPAALGAVSLAPVESTVPRDNLRDPAVAFALGVDPAGGPVLVAATDGVDVDLPAQAADARALHAPGATIVVVSAAALPIPLVRVVSELDGVSFLVVDPPWVAA